MLTPPPPPDHPLQKVRYSLSQLLLDKEQVLEDALTCLLAGGHLLVEDMPGVGKTTLAHALAHLLGLKTDRVQFTADLLPSDLTGVAMFDRQTQGLVFHPGPLFTQVLLADEINRAHPKTQSALLEAMAEGQVSVEGQIRPLPKPFLVIATQNPKEQIGTFPLPESQLDRFLCCVSIGYPSWQAERELLQGQDRRQLLAQMPPVLTPLEWLDWQQKVLQIYVADRVLDRLQRLITATRSGGWFRQGLSPRASLGWLRAAQARALLHGKSYVTPDDLHHVLPLIGIHRLHLPKNTTMRSVVDQIQHLIESIED